MIIHKFCIRFKNLRIFKIFWSDLVMIYSKNFILTIAIERKSDIF